MTDSFSTHHETLRLMSSKSGLAAGTLVTTPDGDKKIEEIKAGDLVLSGVGGLMTRFRKVKKTSSKHYDGPMLRIKSGRANRKYSYQLRATPNHICFGYICDDEPPKEQFSINAFQQHMHSFTHQISIGDDLNASETLEGYDDLDYAESVARKLAQARGGAEIECFAHFTYQEVFRFMPAANLITGMSVPIVKTELIKFAKDAITPEDPDRSVTVDMVKSVKITSITEEQYDGLVYDLDIPETRNFAANGVLVHDSTR